jgi:hypothetical protein
LGNFLDLKSPKKGWKAKIDKNVCEWYVNFYITPPK